MGKVFPFYGTYINKFKLGRGMLQVITQKQLMCLIMSDYSVFQSLFSFNLIIVTNTPQLRITLVKSPNSLKKHFILPAILI